MRQFIIDGSCKEIAMGAGIVEVDGLGFLKTHTFQTYHLKADAILAEIYALDCALQIIQEKGSAERHFEIFSDHQMVHKLFSKELSKPANDLYIDNLKSQVSLIKKFAKFELRHADKSVEQFAKMAHLLSRQYMEDPLTTKVINQSRSMKLIRAK